MFSNVFRCFSMVSNASKCYPMFSNTPMPSNAFKWFALFGRRLSECGTRPTGQPPLTSSSAAVAHLFRLVKHFGRTPHHCIRLWASTELAERLESKVWIPKRLHFTEMISNYIKASKAIGNTFGMFVEQKMLSRALEPRAVWKSVWRERDAWDGDSCDAWAASGRLHWAAMTRFSMRM